MDTRAIDEFESVFEASVRPQVQIEPVSWHQIMVAPDASARSETAIEVAIDLCQRMGVPLRVVCSLGANPEVPVETLEAELESRLEETLARAEAAEVRASGVSVVGQPADALVVESEASPTSLLVIPVPHGVSDVPDHRTLGTTVDHLLTRTGVPVLLVKEHVDDPAALFRRLLVYIPGGFSVGSHFSLPFAMVESPGGALELLHVVNQSEVDRVAEALELVPDVETDKKGSIISAVEQKMQQLLDEAVRKVRDEPYQCRSRVEVGHPVPRVALKLLNDRHTLLVVDSETQENQPIPPEAYSLIKEIAGVPILVL